jgi:hypothetical protein
MWGRAMRMSSNTAASRMRPHRRSATITASVRLVFGRIAISSSPP